MAINEAVRVWARQNPGVFDEIRDFRALQSPEQAKAAVQRVVAAAQRAGVALEACDLVDDRGLVADVAREIIGRSPTEGLAAPAAGRLTGFVNQGNTTVPCPIIATLFAEGYLGTSGWVDIDTLKKALETKLGVSGDLAAFFAEGGRGKEAERIAALRGQAATEAMQMANPTGERLERLDIFKLLGGPIDHKGDLKILTAGGLNEAALNDLPKFASVTLPGGEKALTFKDVSELQEVAKDNDPTLGRLDVLSGKVPGRVELTNLFLIFARDHAGTGDKVLKVSDLVSLYRDHELPKGFVAASGKDQVQMGTGGKLPQGVLGRMLWIQLQNGPGNRSIDTFLGKPPDVGVTNAVRSLTTAVCPARGTRPGTQADELPGMHRPAAPK